MFRKYLQIILLVFFIFAFSCTTKKKVVTDDFATESTDVGSVNSDQGFSDEELSLDESRIADDKVEAKNGDSDELSLEKELQAVTTPEKIVEPVAEVPPPAPVIEPSTNTAAVPHPEIISEPPPAPVVAPVPPPTPVAEKLARVSDVQFKSNDSGGALMISADQPLVYTTRMNSAANQLVIEVQNVQVPNKFKRPLNTKDMTSSIGHIDIYQKQKSNIARFVIQLRPNSEQPLIQPEGTSLMLIGSLISAPENKNIQTGSQLAQSSNQDSNKNNFKIDRKSVV